MVHFPLPPEPEHLKLPSGVKWLNPVMSNSQLGTRLLSCHDSLYMTGTCHPAVRAESPH